MNRGQLRRACCRPAPRRGRPERMSGLNPICRNTPSHIMSPTRSQPGPSAEVARASTDAPQPLTAPTLRRPRREPSDNNPADA